MSEKIIHVRDGLDLCLRDTSDAPAFFELIDANRAHIRPWLIWEGKTLSILDTFDNIGRSQAEFHQKVSAHLGIMLHKQWIGGIGISSVDHVNKCADIGYWLSVKYLRLGIMTASVKALIGYAFTVLDLHRIQIMCATENIRSRGVPERLGMPLEATLRQARQLHDRRVDMCVYAAFREEFV